MNTQYRAQTFAQVLGISKQRVSSLLKDGKLKGIKLGRDMIIDVRDPVNLAWLQAREDLPTELARMIEHASPAREQEESEDQDLYSRKTLEQCIKEAWDKHADYVYKSFVPVACSKLAQQVRKARSLQAAAKFIENYVDQELKDIATYVDHGIIYIIDGEEAAARWSDEHYDEDGNPRAAELEKDKE